MVHLMKNNNKFLKNILTTASTLAIAMGVACEAGAAAVGLAVSTHSSATVINAVNASDWAIFDAANQTLTVNANLTGAFMTNSGVMNITASSSVGSIYGNGGSAAIIVNDGLALHLTGVGYTGVGNDDYGGIASLQLGSTTAGAASSATINSIGGAYSTFYFPIYSITNATNLGVLNTTGSMLFQGAIGPLSALNLTDGSQLWFGQNVSAAQLNLGNANSSMRFTNGTITGNILNTSGAAGNTQIIVNGNPQTLTGNIGTGTAIAALNITGTNFSVNGNINTTAISLLNNTANLTILGGGIAALGQNPPERNIAGTINADAIGHGVINVGTTGTLSNVHFNGIIGGANAPGLLNISTGSAPNVQESSAGLFANATFDGSNHAAGAAGIHVGNNATLVVGLPYIAAIPAGQLGGPANAVLASGIALTLNNGATIDGTGPTQAAVATALGGGAALTSAGQGVVVMSYNNVPGVIGQYGRLQSVQMHALHAVGNVAHQVYTDKLDLTHASSVILDSNSITESITPSGIPYYTSVTSSDSTSITGNTFISQANFTAANGSLTVGNLGVITNIAGTGTLIAQTAIPAPSLVVGGTQNQPVINFSAAGTFQLNGPGSLYGITSSAANTGTFTASLAAAAAAANPTPNVVTSPIVLNFTGAIGSGANTSLNTFTLIGNNNQNTHIYTPAGNIWATNVNLQTASLHAQGNLNIHSTTTTINGALLDTTPTNSTITVVSGNVVLQGDIVINANYTGNPNIAALDLSAANVTNNVTSITFNLAGYTNPNTPVAVGSTMMFVNVPANFNGGGGGLQPNFNSMASLPAGSNGYWAPSGHGVITFYPWPSGANPQQQQGQQGQPGKSGQPGQPQPFIIAGFSSNIGTPVGPGGQPGANGVPNGSPLGFTPPPGTTQTSVDNAMAKAGGFVSGGAGPTSFVFNPGTPIPGGPGPQNGQGAANTQPAAGSSFAGIQPGQQAFALFSGAIQNQIPIPNQPLQNFGGSNTGLNPNQPFQNFAGPNPSFGPNQAGNSLPMNNLANVQAPGNVGTFAASVLTTYSTADSRNGLQTIYGQVVATNFQVFLGKEETMAIATTMGFDRKIASQFVQFILNQGTTNGPAAGLAQNMAKVAVLFPEKTAEMITQIQGSAQNAASATLNNVAQRVGFTNIPTFASGPTFAPPPAAGAGNFGASPAGGTGGANTTGGTAGAGGTRANTNNPSTLAPQQNAEEEQTDVGADLQAVALGIAAGSSPYDKYGVWGSINGGFAHQKLYKGNPGFKSITKGFAVGVDTMLNDRISVGLTISNSMNHIKHKDASLGNKTDSSSWVAAVYGNRQLKHNWFVRGTALFNRTRMNAKEIRTVLTGTGIAQAKYNLISYGGEVNIGFAHTFKNELILTPTVGIRVLHNNKSSYGQQGNTAQNNQISSNAVDNYSALGGLSLSKNIMAYDISFTPEAHANVQYGINQRSPTGSFVSALTPDQTTNFIGTKSSKITSTYGLGLTGSSDRVEVGVTGDVSFSSKYVGYQGSLKLKVKF